MATPAGTALSSKREFAKDILADIVGCGVYAFGVQCFTSPNNIAPGGVTGLAIMIEYLFGFRISVMTLVFNIPLLLLAWFFLGHKFTIRTLLTVGILSAMLQLADLFVMPYQGEMILVSLFGGVLEGFGLGLVFMRGSTTGGTDIASRLLQLKFPHLSMGRLMLVVDGCVLVTSAIVYGSIENALYGLIAIFTSTSIIDNILYGMDTGKVMMIISNSEAEIAATIARQLDRGCTFLQGKGSYTGKDRPVLLCAIRKNQFHNVKRIVYSIDPNAFVVAMEATDVIGEGFKSPEHKR